MIVTLARPLVEEEVTSACTSLLSPARRGEPATTRSQRRAATPESPGGAFSLKRAPRFWETAVSEDEEGAPECVRPPDLVGSVERFQEHAHSHNMQQSMSLLNVSDRAQRLERTAAEAIRSHASGSGT